MQYITLKDYQGNGIDVSRIAMGSTMSMMALSNDEIFRLYDQFVAAGGNIIDTARAYGDGRCEEMVADYLKTNGKGKNIIVSTKGCHPIGDDNGPSRLSLQDLEDDINTSLKVFNRDYFDIYWIHKDDETKPVEEIVDNVNQIIKAGKARFVGCSNWHLDRLQAANAYAKASGQLGFLGNQLQWSLVDTLEEHFAEHHSVVMTKEMYDWHFQEQLPVFAFSSQAQGVFSRIADHGVDSLPDHLKKWFITEDNLKRYERAKAFAEEQGMPISASVLGYLLNNKLPAVAIIGAENSNMLAQSLSAADLKMTADEADALFNV